ncbi:MAG: clostripain-related cysteine peptidase [Desulfurococcaceae archaeon]
MTTDILRATALIILMATIVTPITAINVVFADNNSTSRLAKWTFMVYMVADNNLDPYAYLDFLEMESVGSTSDVNIIVLADLMHVNGTVMYYVEKNGSTVIWGSWSNEYELNMGDPRTLAWFINEAALRYPAQHYALILWDHGDSWNGFGWDETNNDYLTIEEIKEALSNINIKIDLLGFDACLMASIEVAYTLSLTGNVDVMIASEEYVPAYGWPYDKILSKLVENPNMTPEELAKVIVNEYIESYSKGSQGFAPYATMSAINMNKIGEIVSHLGDLSRYLLDNINIYKSFVKAASQSSERFWFGMWRQGPYIDLKDFLLNLLKLRPDLESYIKPVLNEWSNLVIAVNSTRGMHAKNVYGLTIYFPRNRNQFYMPEPYYMSVPEFAAETNWYILLQAVLG